MVEQLVDMLAEQSVEMSVVETAYSLAEDSVDCWDGNSAALMGWPKVCVKVAPMVDLMAASTV